MWWMRAMTLALGLLTTTAADQFGVAPETEAGSWLSALGYMALGVVLSSFWELAVGSWIQAAQDPLRNSVSAMSTLSRRARLIAGQFFSARTSVFHE